MQSSKVVILHLPNQERQVMINKQFIFYAFLAFLMAPLAAYALPQIELSRSIYARIPPTTLYMDQNAMVQKYQLFANPRTTKKN